MRIVVANTSVPFLRGGAEHLADSLVNELRERDHQVEHLKVPMSWHTPLDVASSMVAAASLMMPEAELLIPLKFPVYLIPHANKVPWLLHQFRQVYELWGTPLQDIPDDEEGHQLRRAVHEADNRSLRQCRRIFTNSAVTAGRLKKYNDLNAEVLLPPHGNPDEFRSGPYGDYLLAIGRVSGGKRQALLAKAMAHTNGSLRLVIAGQPETQGELTAIEKVLRENNLGNRVELIPRFITDAEKADLLAGARAVAYLPVDEDSYGYVTAEAMMARRPVLTTTDSGGIHELVEHDVTGMVAQPDPRSLAAAIDRFGADAASAKRLGEAGHQRVQELNLNWDNVIERLTAK